MDMPIRPLKPGDPIPEPHLYTKDEWFDVMKTIRPSLNEADFTEMWDAFQAKKASGAFEAPPQ